MTVREHRIQCTLWTRQAVYLRLSYPGFRMLWMRRGSQSTGIWIYNGDLAEIFVILWRCYHVSLRWREP